MSTKRHINTSEWYGNEGKKQDESKMEVWPNRVVSVRAMTHNFCMQFILGTLPGPLLPSDEVTQMGPVTGLGFPYKGLEGLVGYKGVWGGLHDVVAKAFSVMEHTIHE